MNKFSKVIALIAILIFVLAITAGCRTEPVEIPLEDNIPNDTIPNDNIPEDIIPEDK
ncbi:MAG: hypothetical protein LBB91_09560 [Clostridiales bacterium]|jgi:hypothetical protein|nr:hypothetical protein [Clostridiales bacterium]